MAVGSVSCPAVPVPALGRFSLSGRHSGLGQARLPARSGGAGVKAGAQGKDALAFVQVRPSPWCWENKAPNKGQPPRLVPTPSSPPGEHGAQSSPAPVRPGGRACLHRGLPPSREARAGLPHLELCWARGWAAMLTVSYLIARAAGVIWGVSRWPCQVMGWARVVLPAPGPKDISRVLGRGNAAGTSPSSAPWGLSSLGTNQDRPVATPPESSSLSPEAERFRAPRRAVPWRRSAPVQEHGPPVLGAVP